MKSAFLPLCVATLSSAVVFGAYAQDQPPAPHPPARIVATPAAAPARDSAQSTTNAAAQATAEYKAAQAKCDAQLEAARDACLREARATYEGALSGRNPGLQGNPGPSETK